LSVLSCDVKNKIKKGSKMDLLLILALTVFQLAGIVLISITADKRSHQILGVSAAIIYGIIIVACIALFLTKQN
jgi:hypothetical protein